MGGLIGLLILGGMVIGGIFLVRRFVERRGGSDSDGGDVIAYLLLALAVGFTGFSLASLGRAAFPGDSFITDTDQQVALALAGLVVAGPIATYLWRRQAGRRASFPASAGWTVYLALIEAVFMSALVFASFTILNWLFANGDSPDWTDVLIFGAIVGFHEYAINRTPPASDGSDLPRVVGSAIGLVTAAVGLGGTLYWIFERIYSSLVPSVSNAPEVGTWLALLIVGLPVWYFRWLRPWDRKPGVPHDVWLFLVSTVGLSTAIGSAAAVLIQTLVYIVDGTESAGRSFDFLPAALAVGGVGYAAWWHHRQKLGGDRTDALRAYEYAMTALGMAFAIGGATGTVAFLLERDSDRVDAEPLVAVLTILFVAGLVWYRFWTKVTAVPREIEVAAMPRRFYLVGMSIVTGLTSAGALIGTLVVLFRWLLGSGEGNTLATQGGLFVFAGLALWHLLHTNGQDRDMIGSAVVMTPFDVTIICSHPGMIATLFPKEARLRILYRGDDSAPISDEMAAEIVESVGAESSLVWVADNNFEVAPAR